MFAMTSQTILGEENERAKSGEMFLMMNLSEGYMGDFFFFGIILISFLED